MTIPNQVALRTLTPVCFIIDVRYFLTALSKLLRLIVSIISSARENAARVTLLSILAVELSSTKVLNLNEQSESKTRAPIGKIDEHYL